MLYFINYGTYTLKDGTVVTKKETDFKRAIYPGLVNVFNQIPETIATSCQDLNFEICWGKAIMLKGTLRTMNLKEIEPLTLNNYE